MMRQLSSKYKIYIVLLMLVSLLATSCGFWNPGEDSVSSAFPGDGLFVHFLDVGQADSALIQCGSASMLIDAGNVADGEAVVRYLQEQGVQKLDDVIATHAHEDHAGGMADVLNTFSAAVIYAPVQEDSDSFWQNFVAAAKKQGKTITLCQNGMGWSLGEAAVTVFAPFLPVNADDPNNTSIVLKLTYKNVSFLFTGDAETQEETQMLDANCDLSATVLKVGHHGSSTSTGYRFLRAVMPQMAVISVGKDNPYGHPHEATLSRLSDAGVTVYRTDLNGTIVISTDGTALHVTKTSSTSAAVVLPRFFAGLDDSWLEHGQDAAA